MDIWLNSSWLLLLVPLMLRIAPLPSDRHDPWRLQLDLPLALLCALGTAAFKFIYLGPAILGADDFFMTDEPMVCTTLHGLSSGTISLVTRQPGASLLPALLARFMGAVDALAWGAISATAALGACWFLLARLLYGRTAGLAAALFSCSMTPLALMPRNLTVYPEATLALLVCTLTGAVVLLRKERWALALAGVGAGVALLGDFIGLFYAAPTLAIGMWRVQQGWREQSRRRLAVRLTLLLSPVLLSFGVGRAITPPTMWGLETQIQEYILDINGEIPDWITRMKRPNEYAPGEPPREISAPVAWVWRRMPDLKSSFKGQDYRWGRVGPLEILRSVGRVFLFSFVEQNPGRRSPYGEGPIAQERAQHVYPWLPLMIMALGVFCWALRTRRWELAGLLLLLLPYLLSLRYQMSTRVMPRFLFAPMAAWPILVGVAWAALAQRQVDATARAKALWLRLLAPAVTTVALALMIFGVVPSFLEATAAWRKPNSIQKSIFHRLAIAPEQWQGAQAKPSEDHLLKDCSAYFHYQWSQGLDFRGTLYGQWWRR